MRNLIISALILFALACSSQSLEPIKISQESGMTILANFTKQFSQSIRERHYHPESNQPDTDK